MRNNSLAWILQATFSSLANSTYVFASQHEICQCYVPKDVNCSAADKRSPYLTCDRLLSDKALVVTMWVIGLNAIGGNAFVMVWRKRSTHANKVNTILLSNLASADFLMGIYMLIIASADLYFGDHFPMQSENWRSGIICKFSGALSIVSSEASVFFVMLLSIDRCICIRFPYSSRKLNRKSVSVIALLTWFIAILLGTVPSVLSGMNFKFYDNSHVCIGLPLALTKTFSTRYTRQVERIQRHFYKINNRRDIFITEPTGLANGLYYSTALFLCLNCLCYLVILGCYIGIVRAVKKASKQAGRIRDMIEQITLTTKVTAIVATDFCCWFPIIILGILVQTRVLVLPTGVYAWCVTFVLPINSAINPYLYTVSEIISDYRKKKAKKRKVPKSAHPENQICPNVSKTVQSSTINQTLTTSDNEHNEVQISSNL